MRQGLIAAFLLLAAAARADPMDEALDRARAALEASRAPLAEAWSAEAALLDPDADLVTVLASARFGAPFVPETLVLHVDGRTAAERRFTDDELAALLADGTAPVWRGRLPAGRHVLEVVVRGRDRNGYPYEQAVRARFDKGRRPQVLEIVVLGERLRLVELRRWP